MAELENIMNQMYGAKNKSVQGTYRVMDKLFQQANRKSNIAKGMIQSELNIGKDSDNIENLNSAINNINSIIDQNSNDSLLVGLGNASVNNLNERKSLIKDSQDIRNTATNLLMQSSKLKNLAPEDVKSFEKGVEDLKITTFAKKQTSDTETEVRQATDLLDERISNFKLGTVMKETDPDTRNAAQNMIQETYTNIFDSVPDEYKRAVAVKGSESIMNYSDEIWQVDASRNVALSGMKGGQGDNLFEVRRRRVENHFRNLGDNINKVKGYLENEPISGLFREGRFDDDAIKNPIYYDGLLYQLFSRKKLLRS